MDGPAGLEAEVQDHLFLCARLLDRATLVRAASLARESGATTAEMLVALGWVAERDYVAALAEHLALPVTGATAILPPRLTHGRPPAIVALRGAAIGGRRAVGLRATAVPAGALAHTLLREPAARRQIVLVAGADIEAATMADGRAGMLRRAVGELAAVEPDLSARSGAAPWQVVAVTVLAGLGIGCAGVAPDLAVALFSALLAVPFLCIVLLRVVALIELMLPRRPGIDLSAALPDAALPMYTIMVPLFREAEVLPRLVAALSALDYPASRLEVLLVLEEADRDTREAAAALQLPGTSRIVVVPPGGPQTKPKALDFALQAARGEIVVVYDAEDRPEPRQLRMAAAALLGGDPSVACVQARLNIYNSDAGFLARQFAIEYTVLFDALLPALSRLGWPLPLGGTSNHFHAGALRAVGAWDPYNVTEDADLGFRLARRGLRTVTIASTTWEEAPHDLGNWGRQRTRWLKGWMQTAVTHTRRPRRLWRELGAWQSLGLAVLMSAMLLSVLAFPLFLLLAAIEAWEGRLLGPPEEDAVMAWLWYLAAVNLVLGFATAVLAGILAVVRRGRWRLAPWVLAMPLYWLLISAAGYRAVLDLARRPFHWEKTRHGRTRQLPD